jgi:glucose/arabinose dehydrogenase/chitodextrinase
MLPWGSVLKAMKNLKIFGRRVSVGLAVLMCPLAGLLPQSARAQTFHDAGFASELIATLPQFSPVGLTWAPDGRMFIWQRDGVVRILKNGALLPTPFINISSQVNSFLDRGMLGLALHPNFAENGFVYLLFTREEGGNPTSPAAKVSRLIRVTANPANPDVALPGSELIILGSVGTPPCDAQPAGADCIPSDSNTHSIGTLRFAPDGKLFVGSGDGADAGGVDPKAFRSQDLNSPAGKILRINDDGTAPADNPFYDGTNSWRSKVWIYGLRNPYRYSLHPTTGDLMIGDVGWNRWEEVNRGIRGRNYGWPCFEGNLPEPEYQSALPACFSVPSASVTPPVVTWAHPDVDPALPGFDPNFLGSTAVGGPVYSGSAYPELYLGSFFYADYAGGWIRRLVFDAAANLTGNLLFASGAAEAGIVSIEQGPDGFLYYVAFAAGEVRRIRFNGPVAKATATPMSGASPLTVAFSSNGSTNPGGGALTYAWDFGDGTSSTAANPTHVYSASSATTFTARLTVRAPNGQSSSATVSVTVGSTPPVATISGPASGASVLPGQTVVYQGSASDPEEGALPAGALGWTILLHHNDHIHTLQTSTGASGSFVTQYHGVGTYSYEIVLTATDSSGLKNSTSVTLPVLQDTAPPSAPGGLSAIALGAHQVRLTWTAATDNSGSSGHRVERCQAAGCSNFAQIGTPAGATFDDAGLTASTTYRYRVLAVDATGNLSAYSNIASVTTQAPPLTPVAAYSFNEGAGTSVADASGNGNTGTISGATWIAGKYGGALSFDGTNDLVVINHSSSLNLTTAMTLEAWVFPTAAQSGWRTLIQKEVDAYLLHASGGGSPLAPTGGGTFSGAVDYFPAATALPLNTWSHVALTWDGSLMRLYVNGVESANRSRSGTLQPTTAPLRIGGNSPYGEFFLGRIDEVRVYDRALSAADIQTDMNTPIGPSGPDTAAPSVPGGLTATAVGTQINLSWTASTDNLGVSGYQLERCQGAGCVSFVQIATPPGTTFNDAGLTASTGYSYRVRASDAAGNLSGYSAVASATTATPDTTPPTVPVLTVGAVSPSQVSLSWTASTDNVGVTGYRLERCQGVGCVNFLQIATPSGTTFNDAGLTASTGYSYRVRASDAAGNLSAYSAVASATTATPDTTPPTAPSGLTASAVSSNQVNLSWTASNDNVGVSGYQLERCQGAACTLFAQIATPTGTTFNDAGLAASTTYSYRVRASDASGNPSAYSNLASATTAATTGLVAAYSFNEGSGPSVADASGNGNTGTINGATWTAGKYGGALSFDGTNDVVVINHSSSLGLTAGMTLEAWVLPSAAQGGWRALIQKEVDAYFLHASGGGGALQPTGGGTFGGSVDYFAAPVTLTVNTWTHVALTWNGSIMRLYINGAEAANHARSGAMQNTGAPLRIGGNAPYGEFFLGRIDEVRVYNRALSAAEIQSDMNTPIGPSGPDTTAPSAPGGLAATAVGTQINLSWTASTDNVGVTGYQLERCQSAGCVNFVQIATPSGTALNDAGLTASTTYSYRVRASDAAGNLSGYSAVASATTASPDTTPPTVPVLTVGAVGASQVNLSWAASTDNVGVTGYELERCQGVGCASFVLIGALSSASFGDAGLAAGTSYSYRVRATDAAGNLSAYSNVVSATTTAADTTPPTAPSGLTAASVSANQVNLSWTASADNVGVAGYGVERCQGSGCTSFAQIATPAGTSFNDSGLAGSTTYSYRVRASDAAGNPSAYSNVVSATTAAATGLVAAYSFNEGTGTSVADASGNGNTGTINGATWVVAGKYGAALSFDGTNDLVVINHSSSLSFSTGMTLEAWVLPTAAQSGWRTLIQKEVDAFFLHASGGGAALQPTAGGTFNGSVDYFAPTALAVNTWSHVALTWNGSTMRLYINGVEAANHARGGPMQTTTAPLRIGGNSPYGEFFLGRIDEVRVYNRALSAAEIEADMNTPVGP